ncbi:Uncharacterized protein Fot_03451 [Forsythia ovata]|uniref:Uncharacterized protein n=1 Tax=Forsythia ovata TaxID=205694 RepID=A0ABD1X9U7_9LAMI
MDDNELGSWWPSPSLVPPRIFQMHDKTWIKILFPIIQLQDQFCGYKDVLSEALLCFGASSVTIDEQESYEENDELANDIFDLLHAGKALLELAFTNEELLQELDSLVGTRNNLLDSFLKGRGGDRRWPKVTSSHCRSLAIAKRERNCLLYLSRMQRNLNERFSGRVLVGVVSSQ